MKNQRAEVRFLIWATILLCVITGTKAEANDAVDAVGDALTFLLPATAAGMTVGLKDKKGMIQLGESTVVAIGTTYALKYTVNETRPNGEHYSFPSAHTSLSFSSAEFIRKRYGWDYGIPAYIAATFVGVSRVQSRDHYIHDVIAGAAIGIASSYIFTEPYKGWNVQADIGQNYYGLRLSRLW